jgi:hypothetical protein
MSMTQSPNYIKALLLPNGKKPTGRKVWGIDLETAWLPFFLATNVMGDTAIPSGALGSPIRLSYGQDGSVKFGKTGRPQFKVAKDLSESVKMVRENFVLSLQLYSQNVAKDYPAGYKAEVTKAIDAGVPIIAKDKENLDLAVARAKERELAEAERAVKEAERVVNQKVKGKKAKETLEPEPERELAGVAS